ncbi:hypothetical protein L1049_015251 [Liquidambar formosana]|uniref:Uncharacterized protein n=1 Tax=Liquidambar formosana TaxID=63359 RepID=A0AAP0S3D6_LIQFO
MPKSPLAMPYYSIGTRLAEEGAVDQKGRRRRGNSRTHESIAEDGVVSDGDAEGGREAGTAVVMHGENETFGWKLQAFIEKMDMVKSEFRSD